LSRAIRLPPLEAEAGIRILKLFPWLAILAYGRPGTSWPCLRKKNGTLRTGGSAEGDERQCVRGERKRKLWSV
jgi:hypothetical protein